MKEAHKGSVSLAYTFREACTWLEGKVWIELNTKEGTGFRASVGVAERGDHRGERVIRFKQGKKVYGRAYACCWGHYNNCGGTRIGMYCKALDVAIAQ